jgi:hypothetical protein
MGRSLLYLVLTTLRLISKRKMSGTAQTGQIRSEPSSPYDTQQPVEKKLRLSPSINNTTDCTSTVVAVALGLSEIEKTRSRKQRKKQTLRRMSCGGM